MVRALVLEESAADLETLLQDARTTEKGKWYQLAWLMLTRLWWQ
jgi:hypothetical protein